MNRAIIEMVVLIQKPSYEGFLLKSYKYSLKYF